MTYWLGLVGGLLLLSIAVILVILWQRVYYECNVQVYETWAVQAVVHWCAGAFLLRIRYDSGAGWWWECVMPFWRSDAYTPHDTSPEDEADDEPDEEDDASADGPSPSWQDYLGLLRYAIRVGLIDTIVRYLRRVQARMRPRTVDGEARIGLDDAYTQGLLMGALYAAWVEVAERITFIFTDRIFEGRVTVGGGVRPLALCWDTWRLVTARAVWKTGWYYWRHVRRA